jgi:hypothetical protein
VFTLRPGHQAEQNENVGLDLEGDVEVIDDVVDTQRYASRSPREKEVSGKRLGRMTAPAFLDLRDQLGKLT